MINVQNSTDYEKLARVVYEAILSTNDVETIEVKHNVQIQGLSGVKHQIDVYWRYLKDGIEHQVLVECKYYTSKINLIHARNLLGLMADIPQSRGILLTTVGFQSGVVNFCNHYGIGLKRLRNPQGSDWDGFIQIIDVELTLNKTDYLRVGLTIDGKNSETQSTLAVETPRFTNPKAMVFQDGTDSPVDASTWLGLKIPFDGSKMEQQLEITLKPYNTFAILPSGLRMKLKSIDVKFIHTAIQNNFSLDAMDVVRAVLEDFNTQEIEYTLNKIPTH